MTMPTGPTAHMTLSMAGEAYIKEAESGGKPHLKAYDDGTGTWTIGYGATRGVTKGMKITVQQAQEMLTAELQPCIDAVHRLIKVPISQGLFDALVSFFYNNGWGKCPKLIAAVNSGDEAKVRAAWILYVNAYDAKLKKTVPWQGLINRRLSELRHWAQVDAMMPTAPTVPVTQAPAKLPTAEEPPKPGWVSTAAKSQSVRMQVTALGTLITSWFVDIGKKASEVAGTIWGKAPDVTNEVATLVDTGSTWAGWLGINGAKYVVPLVVVAGTVAVVRHIRDKREGVAA
jgi:lysozyme